MCFLINQAPRPPPRAAARWEEGHASFQRLKVMPELLVYPPGPIAVTVAW